jgi:phage terminase large subunit-like protein
MATASLIDPIRAAKLTPTTFARYATRGDYALPAHIRYIERVLVEVAAGRKRRVILSVPPRHGKSYLCSKYFPAWYLGNFPRKRVLLTSYEADFAASWGRDVRDLLTEHGPTVFGVDVRQDSSAANRWEIQGHAGGMQTAGAGGPILGKGADLAIIDDPIKNFEEAYSETYQEKLWNWYTSTLRSRLEPGGSVLIIQQRWHDEDLVGKILRQAVSGHEKWESIIFPALAEDNDVLGRKRGEALWPERYTAADHATTQAVIPSFVWAAQFQQQPTPFGGNMFKREFAQYYTDADLAGAVIPDKFTTIDTACGTDEQNDFSSIATWGITRGGKLTLLDLDLRRLEAPALTGAILAMQARWPDASTWIEATTQSIHLIQMLRAEGVVLHELEPGAKSKIVRAIPAVGLWEQRKVVLPAAGASAIDPVQLLEAERQLYSFPAGKNDDFVDCLSWGAFVMQFVTTGGVPEFTGRFVERDYLPLGMASLKRIGD